MQKIYHFQHDVLLMVKFLYKEYSIQLRVLAEISRKLAGIEMLVFSSLSNVKYLMVMLTIIRYLQNINPGPASLQSTTYNCPAHYKGGEETILFSLQMMCYLDDVSLGVTL